MLRYLSFFDLICADACVIPFSRNAIKLTILIRTEGISELWFCSPLFHKESSEKCCYLL